MTDSTPKRILETRSLCDILPSPSTSSAREFARIVNLLLSSEARRNGRTLTLFDDRSGDFRGLDAFEKMGRSTTVGYQHKFYRSPLSDSHRADIEESLLKTASAFKQAKVALTKWVLVTPQDLVESATRKSGGDVTWFEGLRRKLALPFVVEHLGHTKLQALFLEAPFIGLYYYPELFKDGSIRCKTIQQLRVQYDNALKREFGRIEFVGMSVYKEEAARTVPIENIYIRLSVVPSDADENDPSILRYNPLEFLEPGARHVVLGDPGSGKTTLLKFLALYGQSEQLQRRSGKKEGARFQFVCDQRLPILVTLSRYARALKPNENLSLVDYMGESIRADFSIDSISSEFLEYYLASGQAILLFDGLDELPDPSLKQRVRKRIENLSRTYPGNTIVVTSRIYGYEGTVPFDGNDFTHYRLAKLQMNEIEQFVDDWYGARLEKLHDRREYLSSLINILRNEEHVAIRDLARNPQLLTIMVLVHRVDAVLPDERHVLYQKCTETLLNTWHNWKSHEMEHLHQAKVDRQNMQRMQAIAFWMHHQMGEADTRQQTVVTYGALLRCLTEHIASETPPNIDYAPQDLATTFIEFVQDRAGLLVEIGDHQFSFIHLTFQEHLAAAHIRTLSELDGVRDVWNKQIKNHCHDPRWREVIRLLIAGYGSNASQEFLIERILATDLNNTANAQLLGGLLIDGVAAAQMRKTEVLEHLLLAASSVDHADELSRTLIVLKACRTNADGDWQALKSAARSLSTKIVTDKQTRLRQTMLSVGLDLDQVWNLCGRGTDHEVAELSLVAGKTLTLKDTDILSDNLELLWHALNLASLTSNSGTLLSVVLSSLTSGLYPITMGKVAFGALLSTLSASTLAGPFQHFGMNALLFSRESTKVLFGASWLRAHSGPRALDQQLDKALDRALALTMEMVRDLALDRALTLDQALDRALDLSCTRVQEMTTDPAWTLVLAQALALAQDRTPDRALVLGREPDLNHARDQARDRAQIVAQERISALGRNLIDLPLFQDRNLDWVVGSISLPDDTNAHWRELLSASGTIDSIEQYLCAILSLAPNTPWGEVFKIVFLPTIPSRIHLADFQWWKQTSIALKEGKAAEADIYAAAFQLIFDGFLYISGYHEPDADWLQRTFSFTKNQIVEHNEVASKSRALLAELADQTRDLNSPPLRIAHCIRDLAYGDVSRTDELVAMSHSDQQEYREIFENSYWRSTDRNKRGENPIEPYRTDRTTCPPNYSLSIDRNASDESRFSRTRRSRNLVRHAKVETPVMS